MRSRAASPTRTPYNASPRAAIAPRPARLMHRTWGPANLGANRPLATGGSGLHFELPLGVAAQDLDLVLIAQRHGLHPLHRWLVGDEGPVDRKQDTVDAHLHHAAQQRRIGEVAAGGDVEVAAEGLAEAQGVVRLADLPAEWSRQHRMLGFPAQ